MMRRFGGRIVGFRDFTYSMKFAQWFLDFVERHLALGFRQAPNVLPPLFEASKPPR